MGVGEGLLDRGDREEGEVGFRLGMVDEVDVYQLFDFNVGRCDVCDDRGEEGKGLLISVHHLELRQRSFGTNAQQRTKGSVRQRHGIDLRAHRGRFGSREAFASDSGRAVGSSCDC